MSLSITLNRLARKRQHEWRLGERFPLERAEIDQVEFIQANGSELELLRLFEAVAPRIDAQVRVWDTTNPALITAVLYFLDRRYGTDDVPR